MNGTLTTPLTPVFLARSWLKQFQRASLRTQLLLVINIAVAFVLAGFVGFDYLHTVRARVHDKRVALSEEAPVLDDMTVLTVGVTACTLERRALRCATLSGT
jgi:hypothetical protein